MVEKPSGQRYVATVTVAGILLPESRPLNLRYCTVMPNPQASGHEQITMSNVVPEGKGPSAAIARTIAVREAAVDGPVSLDHATAQLEQLVLPLRLATPASVRLGYLKLRPGTLGEGAAEGSTHPGLDHLGPLALVELSADDCALIEATLPQLFYDRRIDDPLRRFTVAVNEEDRAEACLKFLVAGEALVNPNTESRDRKSHACTDGLREIVRERMRSDDLGFGPSWGDHVVLDGERGRFAPAREIKPREDATHVVACRGLGDEQLLADLAVGVALRQQREHFAFSRRQ